MDALNDIAHRYDLAIIEDAAHALPAKYKGRFIGSGSNPTAFSFYATKNLTTAEGGMLTGAAELLERARVLSLHGMSRDAWKRYDKGGSWYYEVVAPGFKYNMTDIQAKSDHMTLAPCFGALRRGESCIRPAGCDLPMGDHKDRPYRSVPIFCGLI
jgi:dTDP-4-amino-4,6-dideoxygalactose transaminase